MLVVSNRVNREAEQGQSVYPVVEASNVQVSPTSQSCTTPRQDRRVSRLAGKFSLQIYIKNSHVVVKATRVLSIMACTLLSGDVAVTYEQGRRRACNQGTFCCLVLRTKWRPFSAPFSPATCETLVFSLGSTLIKLQRLQR